MRTVFVGKRRILPRYYFRMILCCSDLNISFKKELRPFIIASDFFYVFMFDHWHYFDPFPLLGHIDRPKCEMQR